MPLTRIGPERAKIVRSQNIVSILTMIAAAGAMNRVAHGVDVSWLSLASNKPSGIQIFRLTDI